MKDKNGTDLNKPHIYIDGVPVESSIAKAAPELLEALKAAKSTIKALTKNQPMDIADINTLDMVDKAIKKATT